MPGKVLAYLFMMWIYNQLQKLQRPEQSEFMPAELTTDHILVLSILIKCQYEFQQRMPAVHVDLKKTFGSVHHEAL